MKLSMKVVSALLFALALSLFGCGSESGSGISDSLSLGKQVVSKGAIEKFGSLVVNGVEFKTKGAILHLPDDTVTPERTLQSETEVVDNKLLKLGMVVTVKGTVDDNGTTGTATEIEFRDTLKAKIDDNGVDLVNNTITVMGHKIGLDDKIKPLLASLKPGDVVQLSGLPDNKGQIKATFIEKKEATEVEHLAEFEVKGFVSNVSGNTAVIKLDPTAATGVTVNFPAGTVLKNGDFMEVKIPKTTTVAANGSITVAEAPHVEDVKISLTPTTPGAPVQISLEGFPSSIDPVNNSLVLNGQQVKFDPATTTFVGGTKAILDPTKKIQVQGVITGTVLNAEKIEFKALAVKNPGVSKGKIERLGSVVVNGVEFRTTGAILHLRDNKTTPDRVLQTETELQVNNLLKPGMVVTVKGGFDDNGTTGTATEIEFRNVLEGTIDDKGVDFITVLGQKVGVDDPAKLAGLAVGDKVGISGLADDRGQITATHIEKNNLLTEFETKGIISGFSGGNTFTLLPDKNAATGITVNLGSGVSLPAGATNGSFVEVRTLSVANGTAIATLVQLEDVLEAAENEKKHNEGFITKLTTADDFVVNGQPVHLAATTTFVGGIKADLVVGMKVEAEGNIVGGILNATKVVFNDNVRIDAILGGAVNGATTAAQANLTLLGKKVVITSTTDLKGLNGTTLALSSVATGQELIIRGVMAANGSDIIATRVDLKDTAPDPLKFRPSLRGPVTAKDAVAGTLTIAGMTVKAGTNFVDNKVPPAAVPDFFTKVIPNSTAVKVTWNPGDATTATIREAELET